MKDVFEDEEKKRRLTSGSSLVTDVDDGVLLKMDGRRLNMKTKSGTERERRCTCTRKEPEGGRERPLGRKGRERSGRAFEEGKGRRRSTHTILSFLGSFYCSTRETSESTYGSGGFVDRRFRLAGFLFLSRRRSAFPGHPSPRTESLRMTQVDASRLPSPSELAQGRELDLGGRPFLLRDMTSQCWAKSELQRRRATSLKHRARPTGCSTPFLIDASRHF